MEEQDSGSISATESQDEMETWGGSIWKSSSVSMSVTSLMLLAEDPANKVPELECNDPVLIIRSGLFHQCIKLGTYVGICRNYCILIAIVEFFYWNYWILIAIIAFPFKINYCIFIAIISALLFYCNNIAISVNLDLFLHKEENIWSKL